MSSDYRKVSSSRVFPEGVAGLIGGMVATLFGPNFETREFTRNFSMTLTKLSNGDVQVLVSGEVDVSTDAGMDAYMAYEDFGAVA